MNIANRRFTLFTKRLIISLIIVLMSVCFNQTIVYSNPTTILHSFGYPDLECPNSLTQGSDGCLYGTTYYGGFSNDGTIFKYDISTGAIYTLHDFWHTVTQGNQDGCNPDTPLIQASDGNLYGTTSEGGNSDNGTIYKYNITTKSFTVIHRFGDGSVSYDGTNPKASLIQGPDGNLYGTTYKGGYGCGTIFKYDITTGNYTVLHIFYDGSVINDGSSPMASLVKGSDGNLYGTTCFGGSGGYGTIFKYNITTGSYSVLHRFCDGSITNDGACPYSSLINGPDGNLYGTTRYGGSGGDVTIYKYNISSGTVTILYSLKAGTVTYSSDTPSAPLTLASDGNLYGTLPSGGSAGGGSIFRYNIITGDCTVVRSFCDGSIIYDGASPYASLVQASDGNLYGTTSYGGINGCGTVYKYSITTEAVNIVSNDTDGYDPRSSLIQATDGNFYGTTYLGGHAVLHDSTDYGYGTIYKYNALSGSYTVVHRFRDGSVDNDGAFPHASLIQASDGNLYGTTYEGGTAGYGTIFRYNISSGVYTILHHFADGSVLNDGRYPLASLLQASDGKLYGTTSSGGSASNGTIYKYDISTGIVTILHSFGDGSITGDGYDPEAALIQVSDGNLYGTTSSGGSVGKGTIYKYNISTGIVTILHSFADGSVAYEGNTPLAPLMQASDGNLYGTTYNGPYNYSCYGTIFKYELATGNTTILHGFTETDYGWTVGSPCSALIQTIDGNLYGTTSYYYGSIFQYNIITGNFTKLTGSDRSEGSLLQTSDGNIYGSTTDGGLARKGTIFKLNTSKTELTTSLNPSTSGQSVTFNAVITGNSPTGTVQFMIDGANTDSPVTLISGKASYTTSSLTIGNHTITAVYSGDANNIGSTSNTITQTVVPPLAITSLSPSSVAGAATFTLTVNGTSFVNGSIIKWNGTNMTTTFVSSTQITASINKYYTTLSSYPGSATITVLNPDGKRSSGATLTITQPVTPPAITSLSPSTVSGAKTFTLTVNGSNFVSGSIIKWNGTNMTTTFVSAKQLTASINKYYDTLSSYPGSATISVLNPDGARSSGSTLTITAPLPVISSLSPSSITGATTFTLTVNGSNFQSGAVIKWNGTNMTTTYVSATQLTASINKYYDTLSSYPGSATISILNPDGGRSTGATLTINQPVTPPTITSLSPSSITGATTFTLTVNGTSFQSGAVIKWNGTNMTTTYVSATQLTATINKYYDTLSSYPGSATISVLNPDSGRSTGTALAITSP